MSEGWKCPGCGSCFAPWVAKCDTCGQMIPSVIFRILPTAEATTPPCLHLRQEATTAGMRCVDCGEQIAWPPWSGELTAGGSWES
jgi:uncharacterized OB-fold protein